MSKNVMAQLSEAYFKIRNTFRFALGNLSDFDPSRDALADDSLEELDRWMLGRTSRLVAKCLEFYESFDFHRVYHALYDFCVVDLSAFYFDILKDRLYTFASKGCERRSAQTAIYRIASALARLLAPILAFTTDEIWRHLPHSAGDPESVHLALFPTTKELGASIEGAKAQEWERLMLLRTIVLQALEDARNKKMISSALEAKVTVGASSHLIPMLREYAAWLPTLFIVSQVEISEDLHSDPLSGFTVSVSPAEGAKCERCWNYSLRVGESPDYPTVCERCLPVLREIEGAAGTAGANS
jgi:isoleucyl-tRNA synthetase